MTADTSGFYGREFKNGSCRKWHFFGAGGAFLTKNGKKGERKGRFLRARVAESSLFPFVIRQVQVNDPVIVALWTIKQTVQRYKRKRRSWRATRYLYTLVATRVASKLKVRTLTEQ